MSQDQNKPAIAKNGKLPNKNGWWLIHPESAEALIKVNTEHQRTPFKQRGDTYSGQMTAKKWFPTGQPLIIFSNGAMGDGQNRCLACMSSGTPFLTYVVVDIDPQAFAYIDTGKSRNVSDILKIKGEVYTGKLSTIARLIWEYQLFPYPLASYKGYAPANEILEVVAEFPELRYSCYFVMTFAEKYLRNRMAVFVHFSMIRSLGKDKGDAAFLKYSNGDGLRKSNPLLYLRNLAITNYTTGNSERIAPSIMLGTTIKAVDKFLCDKTVTGPMSIKYNPKIEEFPRYTEDLFNVKKKPRKVTSNDDGQLRLVG